MKKVIFVALLGIITVTGYSQPGKNKPKNTDSTKIPTSLSDTLKVRYTYYAEDGGSKFTAWEDGYAIRTVPVFNKRLVQDQVQVLITDKTYIPVKVATKDYQAVEWK